MRIKHKGLRRLAVGKTPIGIDPALLRKLNRILAALAVIRDPASLDNPGWQLHRLKGGRLAGHWSIRVTANWRVTFRFEDGEAVDVNFIDYH